MSAECHLCMEELKGRGHTTLKCGHEMCAECFATHARINHTCPFCRDEFAPKIIPRSKERIPLQMVERVIINHLLSDKDFYYGLNRRINWEIEPSRQVAILRTAVGNICLEAMTSITRWYNDT